MTRALGKARSGSRYVFGKKQDKDWRIGASFGKIGAKALAAGAAGALGGLGISGPVGAALGGIGGFVTSASNDLYDMFGGDNADVDEKSQKMLTAASGGDGTRTMLGQVQNTSADNSLASTSANKKRTAFHMANDINAIEGSTPSAPKAKKMKKMAPAAQDFGDNRVAKLAARVPSTDSSTAMSHLHQ